MSINLGKAIVALLVVWLLVIILMTGPLYHSNDTTTGEHLSRQLTKAMDLLELLKKQNEEFQSLLADFRQIGRPRSTSGAGAVVGHDGGIEPPCSDQMYSQLRSQLDRANKLLRRTEDIAKQQQQERVTGNSGSDPSPGETIQLERRIERGVREMWYYVNAQLKKVRTLSSEETVQKQIDVILEGGADHKRTLLVNIRNLSHIGGRADWAAKELQDLEDLVQARIAHLQNPKDCAKAKRAICNLNKGCGYGCQLHHAVYCFVLAYGTRRTLILKSQGWRYNRQGWEAVFQPLSETCTDRVDENALPPPPWPGTDDTPVIQLPIVDSLQPRPKYLPLAVPKDLAPRLVKVHGNPSVWWIAQFVKYLLRPRDETEAFLVETETKMKFQKPIVGLHVRRTDKVGTEAAFHGLDEYMYHVEDYYRMLSLQGAVDVKRVYLATDDPSVLDEARKKFPDYTFLGDPSIAKLASVSSRYSDDSLKGIIVDIHLLSKCDYLVCTFSSQVCRVAYEIMQTLHPVDASSNFYSLDDIYYFGGQSAHNQRALYAHRPRTDEEIGFEPGDVIGIAGNHWDGYSKGINRRTNQEGLYPSYKAEELLDVADMPTYDEAVPESVKDRNKETF